MLTIDRVFVSMTLRIENSNYFETPLEVVVSKDFLIYKA